MDKKVEKYHHYIVKDIFLKSWRFERDDIEDSTVMFPFDGGVIEYSYLREDYDRVNRVYGHLHNNLSNYLTDNYGVRDNEVENIWYMLSKYVITHWDKLDKFELPF